jgi:hypothetical protein
LKPVNFANFKKDKAIETENKMDLVKLHFITFKKDSVSVYNAKKIVWFSEKHCNVSFFRLGDNFLEKNQSAINPILNKIHLGNILSQLNCSTRYEYSSGQGIEQTVKIGYLDSNLLGFEIFSAWDCGGAHPDFGGQGYLLDLNNGKNYDIDDIIAFDKSVTSDKKGSFDNYSKYRSAFFAPKLLALINESEHFIKPKEGDEDNCDYTDVEFWNFPAWNYTKKGIEFTPSFYRAARNCEESFIVSFDKLKKYKNTSFPYPF